MVMLRQADPLGDVGAIRELWTEYLHWGNAQVGEHYGLSLPIADMLEGNLADLSRFVPPRGGLLLAIRDDRVHGVGAFQPLSSEVAEVKRMYVRPAARGTGLGRALLHGLIDATSAAGYRSVRLDTAGFMQAAQALYRSAGFQAIAPYPESEVPPELHRDWLFLERRLS